MLKQLLPLSALALLTLSSCVELQVGAVIREPARYATAVDASKPQHKKAYRISKDEYVYQAPVIRGAYQPRLIYMNMGNEGKFSRYYAGSKKATGEWRWVRVRRDHTGTFRVTHLDKRPHLKKAKLVDTSHFSYVGKLSFNYGESRSSGTRRLLAAPFDYVIDPIASVPLTALGYGVFALGAPVGIIGSQFQDSNPSSSLIKAHPSGERDYVSIDIEN